MIITTKFRFPNIQLIKKLSRCLETFGIVRASENNILKVRMSFKFVNNSVIIQVFVSNVKIVNPIRQN